MDSYPAMYLPRWAGGSRPILVSWLAAGPYTSDCTRELRRGLISLHVPDEIGVQAARRLGLIQTHDGALPSGSSRNVVAETLGCRRRQAGTQDQRSGSAISRFDGAAWQGYSGDHDRLDAPAALICSYRVGTRGSSDRIPAGSAACLRPSEGVSHAPSSGSGRMAARSRGSRSSPRWFIDALLPRSIRGHASVRRARRLSAEVVGSVALAAETGWSAAVQPGRYIDRVRSKCDEFLPSVDKHELRFRRDPPPPHHHRSAGHPVRRSPRRGRGRACATRRCSVAAVTLSRQTPSGSSPQPYCSLGSLP